MKLLNFFDWAREQSDEKKGILVWVMTLLVSVILLVMWFLISSNKLPKLVTTDEGSGFVTSTSDSALANEASHESPVTVFLRGVRVTFGGIFNSFGAYKTYFNRLNPNNEDFSNTTTTTNGGATDFLSEVDESQ